MPSSVSTSAALPGNEVRQTMLEALDLRKRSNPDRVFAKLPASRTAYADGFRSVTYSEVWRAVNRVAWWLEEKLGKSETFDTIAYLGPGDIRYSIILLAAMKTGHKVFFPSLRNSKVAFEALFHRVGCRAIATTSPEPAPVSLLSDCGVSQRLHVPSLQELLEIAHVEDYGCIKTYEEAKNDPVCVLHTSGSTGIPKPLVFTNEFIAAVASNTSVEAPDGFTSPNSYLVRDTCLVTLPAFHMAGLAFTLFVPIFKDNIPIYPLPGSPPALHSLIEAVSNTNVNWALVAPVMLQALAQDIEGLTTLSKKISKLFFIGGSLSKDAGDAVRKHIPLYQIFGLSEAGSLPLVYRADLSQITDWRSVEFHPQQQAQLRHRFDNLYELVLASKSVHGRREPPFAIFPDIDEYKTGDLFSPHPEKPNSWIYESRADDVLVYSTGEKANPVTFENIVSGHPLVRGAVMIGEGRFESSLLVELVEDKDVPDEKFTLAIDSIWPTIEEANSAYPAYARISRSKILLTKPSAPMVRTGKGTIQRRASISLYRDAIDDMYNKTNATLSFNFPSDIDLTNLETVSLILEGLVKHLTGWDHIPQDEDFFALGMDSLIVIRMSQELKHEPRLTWMGPRTIYENPSIHLLATSIVKHASHTNRKNGDTREHREITMARLLEEHTKALTDLCSDLGASRVKENAPNTNSRHIVLLTGSTGQVGSFVLDKLLADESVDHIYCLNRTHNSGAVQERRGRQRGLGTSFPAGRVTFLTGQLGKSDLGLSPEALELLKSKVTIIVHTAWPVDFSLSLISFRPSLRGVVNLLALAAHSVAHASVLFLSSISAVANCSQASHPHETVPELIIQDAKAPATNGYGESKYTGEMLMDYASRHLGIKTGIVRIAQVAGSIDSLRGWSQREWFPTLVMASEQIGALPETLGHANEQYPAGILGDMNWIPVDRLNSFILDSIKVLAARKADDGPLVLHAASPFSTPWTALLPTVRSALSASETRANEPEPKREIKVVPFAEWLALLHARSVPDEVGKEAGSKAEAPISGVKLLDFYSSLAHEGDEMARLGIAQSEKLIPSLRNCEPLRPEWMAGWIQDWLSPGQEPGMAK